jgi:hypothetical protein
MIDKGTIAGRQASRSMLERRNMRLVAFNVEWSHLCRVLHASARKLACESGLCAWFEHRHALHLTHVRRGESASSEIDIVVMTKSFHLMQPYVRSCMSIIPRYLRALAARSLVDTASRAKTDRHCATSVLFPPNNNREYWYIVGNLGAHGGRATVHGRRHRWSTLHCAPRRVDIVRHLRSSRQTTTASTGTS